MLDTKTKSGFLFTEGFAVRVIVDYYMQNLFCLGLIEIQRCSVEARGNFQHQYIPQEFRYDSDSKTCMPLGRTLCLHLMPKQITATMCSKRSKWKSLFLILLVL